MWPKLVYLCDFTQFGSNQFKKREEKGRRKEKKERIMIMMVMMMMRKGTQIEAR